MRRFAGLLVMSVVVALFEGLCWAQTATTLPDGAKVVWDLKKAYRETTTTRERICINGLWRFQPRPPDRQAAEWNLEEVPTKSWGYFQVPGPWPDPTRQPYMNAGDSQQLYRAPKWQELSMMTVDAAWYQREVTIPTDWTGRTVLLEANYVNSYAAVYLDGKPAGEITWPGGKLDITSAAKPGQTQVLTILVAFKPRKTDITAFLTDKPQEPPRVPYRGLCGDVFLAGVPTGARLANVKVNTSTRKWEIELDATLSGLAADQEYTLRAQVLDDGKEVKHFESLAFTAADLKDGRFKFATSWRPGKLWDLHTPANQYQVKVMLLDGDGKVRDEFQPVRFGFREFWIDGRDFYLNGTRVWGMIVVLDSVVSTPAAVTYETAKRTFRRMKAAGMNMAYGHNYACKPGSNLAYEEILRAADDVGIMLAYTVPDHRDYGWRMADRDKNPEKTSGYSHDLEYFVREAQNHPSLVIYVMHDGGGSAQDQNPDWIDQKVGAAGWRQLQAEKAVHDFDQTRPIWHHAGSGQGLQIYSLNNYLDFAPIQERSEWYGHWSRTGSVPLVLVEYGFPLDHNWLNYKEGYVLFGSPMTHEFMSAEWGAQFRGDQAYELTEAEKENLRFEVSQWQAQKPFHFGSYKDMFSGTMPNMRDVQGMYLEQNWPAFRTWGISGITAWVLCRHFNPTKEAPTENEVLRVDWEKIQRPGYSPDLVRPQARRWDIYGEPSDWAPDRAARAIVRYSQPAMAWLAGKSEHWTGRNHIFRAGESFEKQAILINNSREDVTFDCTWSLGLARPVSGSTKVSLTTGQMKKVPFRLEMPAGTPAGSYQLKLTAELTGGDVQEDSLVINVVADFKPPRMQGNVALFDPVGETARMLSRMGVQTSPVEADAELANYDTLIIGKKALTAYGPGPDISRVREGLKVIVFEQTQDVLENRLGFRVQEHVLRQVWPRLAGHPVLAGLDAETLADWRGEGTTVEPRIDCGFVNSREWITGTWAGFTQPRLWRVGCYGSVASLLMEKPACGDFLPILDGGFSVQYSPLMEYREGSGLVLFCQMDVTGRTEADPAAEQLVSNVLSYVSAWKATSRRKAVYVGEEAGKKHLESTGIAVGQYDGGKLETDQVLIVGPRGAKTLAGQEDNVRNFVTGGGHLLLLAQTEDEANAILPFNVTMKKDEHISTTFTRAAPGSLLAGIARADVYTRDAKQVPLLTGGVELVGDGVLAHSLDANVVFCQLVPWRYDYDAFNGGAWHMYYKMHNIKWTFQRTSCLLSRLLGNMGVGAETPLLARFGKPAMEGDSLQDLVDGSWIESGGEEVVISTQWKGLPIANRGDPPEGWERPEFDESLWRPIRLPGQWDLQYEDVASGRNWTLVQRVKFTVSDEMAGQEAKLFLGTVQEEDWTYINGTLVGAITAKGPTKGNIRTERQYTIPKGVLKEGENVLAVRCTTWGSRGGLLGMKTYSKLHRHQLARLENLDAYLSPEEVRYIHGLYLDTPYPYDDPYRYWRW